MQQTVIVGRGVSVSAPLASRPSRKVARISAVARPQIARSEASAAPAQPLAQRLAFQASAAAVLLQVGPAHADAEVDSAVNNVIGAVKVTGDLVKSGIVALQAGVQVLQQVVVRVAPPLTLRRVENMSAHRTAKVGLERPLVADGRKYAVVLGYEAAAPVLKQGYEQVAPVVSEVATQVSKAAAPAFKSAAPVISDTVRSSIQSAGVDLNSLSTTGGAVAKSATEAAAAAAPALASFVEFLGTADPLTLGEYTLGFLGVFYLSPPLLRAVFGVGSDNTVSATAALDSIVKQADLVFIDVRSNSEKLSGGVPDVPSSVSSGGALRNPGYIEAQTTALQIAALKKVNKGTKIVLMDRNGGVAKAVAKELSKKGYKSVSSVEGGFDGRNGWIQSKLQIKPFSSSMSFAPMTGKLGTSRTRTTRQLSA
ncbi:MAG: hypothetical protein WDW38_004445 [Sanguina aurantia]